MATVEVRLEIFPSQFQRQRRRAAALSVARPSIVAYRPRLGDDKDRRTSPARRPSVRPFARRPVSGSRSLRFADLVLPKNLAGAQQHDLRPKSLSDFFEEILNVAKELGSH